MSGIITNPLGVDTTTVIFNSFSGGYTFPGGALEFDGNYIINKKPPQ